MKFLKKFFLVSIGLIICNFVQIKTYQLEIWNRSEEPIYYIIAAENSNNSQNWEIMWGGPNYYFSDVIKSAERSNSQAKNILRGSIWLVLRPGSYQFFPDRQMNEFTEGKDKLFIAFAPKLEKGKSYSVYTVKLNKPFKNIYLEAKDKKLMPQKKKAFAWEQQTEHGYSLSNSVRESDWNDPKVVTKKEEIFTN
ncbi:hypothetical protein M1446_04275 [Candidatus Dependentiae bacterium]|nr:hypothetical protein [Candidatus Dependentiae bacterium]